MKFKNVLKVNIGNILYLWNISLCVCVFSHRHDPNPNAVKGNLMDLSM